MGRRASSSLISADLLRRHIAFKGVDASSDGLLVIDAFIFFKGFSGDTFEPHGFLECCLFLTLQTSFDVQIAGRKLLFAGYRMYPVPSR